MLARLSSLVCTAVLICRGVAVETICAYRLSNMSVLEGTYQYLSPDSYGIKQYASTDCEWCYWQNYFYRAWNSGTYSFYYFFSASLEDNYTWMWCQVTKELEYGQPVRATECTTDNPNANWYHWDASIGTWAWDPAADVRLCETGTPSRLPTTSPTNKPTRRTDKPTMAPTNLIRPTFHPTESPTDGPTTSMPSVSPTRGTTTPTKAPVRIPTSAPSSYPTPGPVTKAPTLNGAVNAGAKAEVADESGQIAGMSSAVFIIVFVLLPLLLLAAFMYWCFFVRKPAGDPRRASRFGPGAGAPPGADRMLSNEEDD